MTRKKWNRLKRQRPELFKDVQDVAWEVHDLILKKSLAKYSTREAIAVLTSYQLHRES